MHTPAKGAGPNKGLGGSNPPFSAINPIKSTVYERKGDSSYISSYTLTEAEAFDICRRPFAFAKKSHPRKQSASGGFIILSFGLRRLCLPQRPEPVGHLLQEALHLFRVSLSTRRGWSDKVRRNRRALGTTYA